MSTDSRFLLLLAIAYILLSGFVSLGVPDADTFLKAVKQDVLVYAKAGDLDKPLITKEDGQKIYHDYLVHYFSPWNQPNLLYNEKKIKKIEEDLINRLSAEPGWGINQQRHTKEWVSELSWNMNLGEIPPLREIPRVASLRRPLLQRGQHASAITVSVTHLKKLPTVESSFKAWADPSNGYPFNQMEVSLLPANLPIKVIHISRDGAWALVLTPYNAIGWLPFNDFAFVDKAFMQSWQTAHYAAVVKDKLGLYDSKQHFLFFARIGSVHPIVATLKDKYRVLVAKSGPNHQAVSQVISLGKADSVELPMSLTPRNFAKVANVMLGQPYDWGGHYGYRDCSATTMDLFAPFGLWLPRSSVDQAHTGNFTSLENLDAKAKQAFIRQHAVPFLTLLWMPGHIALYLGEQNEQSFVYQTIWGFPVKHWFKGSRLPIGKTVITPLDMSEGLSINATGFFERIKGMTVLLHK